MTKKSKILLCEDDNNLGYVLCEYLKMNNFEVTLAKDGEEGLKAFQADLFDLCVLDIMMPKKDGFALAREIKSDDPHVPIIFLTAKALKVDKLKGFNLGADDYILKPVDEEELIARINAIIRRSSKTNDHNPASAHVIGRYTFNYSIQELVFEDGEKQLLTGKENEVLNMLCNNKNQILDRKSALHQLWGENDYFNRRSMDVFISKLRKYLSKDKTIKIRNVHGKGFILEEK